MPYTETRYLIEEVVKEVPYEETTYEKFVIETPYDVEVCRWVPVTEEVTTPKVVRRRVDYEVNEDVAKTVWMKIPVDECGREIGPATPLYSDSTGDLFTSGQTTIGNQSIGYGSTFARRPSSDERQIVETSQTVKKPGDSTEVRYKGNLTDGSGTDETGFRNKSVLVPESEVERTKNLKPIVIDETESQESDAGEENQTGDGENGNTEQAEENDNVQDLSEIENLKIGSPAPPKATSPEADPGESGESGTELDANDKTELNQRPQPKLSSPD